MRGRIAALVVLGLLVAACAASSAPRASMATPAPDPGVLIGNANGVEVRVEVVDQTGWLLEATAAFSPGFSWNAHVSNPPGNMRTVVLEWIGGECERHRSVVLKVVGGQLEMDLNRGSQPELPNGELCADVARFYTVRLDFDRDVRATSVALHVTGLGSSGFIRE